MPKKFCCIKKCPTNNAKDHTQVFEFPDDRERWKKWLRFAKLPSVPKGKGICIRHFTGNVNREISRGSADDRDSRVFQN